jgi:D-glycero-D-manno-heptose 1,7-bisphosphate phosphatase
MKSEIKRVLFLDRDGVINVDKHFVSQVDDIVFVEGIFQLCRYFKSINFEIVIVTNQSGVSRGLFSEVELRQVMDYILKKFEAEGITILTYLYCPHGPDDLCVCRKPLPGMFTRAIQKLNVQAEDCISIGDRERDILAAVAAGIPLNFLLLSDEQDESRMFGPIVVKSLTEIIQIHQSTPPESQI